MIPRIIHQIWVGNNPRPSKWMNTWKTNHPDWQYLLWNEEKIKELGLVNEDVYRFYYMMECWHGCADVVRVEVLFKYGGVYLDADTTCTHPIDELIKRDFFAVYEPGKEMGRIANGIIGVSPLHRIMKDYIMAIRSAESLTPPYNTIGAPMFKKIIQQRGKTNQILNSYSFFRTDKMGNKVAQIGKNYADHYYSTTYLSPLKRYSDGQ